MSKVKLLPPEVCSKIAAGEVIVRPGSVVKELIENSLDAGAKRIEIEIEAGGKKKIIVNDDGTGMAREDAILSLERYATSKISSIEDIENIKTLGFRGEALASIAQVSHLELETSDGTLGTKIIVQAPEKKQVIDMYRENGTRVKVSNLFFNLPARLKFLKSDEYERRIIVDLVKTYALISPQVHFTLSETGRNILNISSTNDLKTRLMQIYPQDIILKLLPLDLMVGAIVFNGFISQPDFFLRHNLNFIYVNNRPVKYPRIVRIISEIYQQPKYAPAFLLNISIPPQLLDVNIHPTKNEVKIKEERYVIDLLTQGIKKKIFPGVVSREYTVVFSETKDSQSETKFVQESIIPYPDTAARQVSKSKEQVEFWQLHNTYILAQTSTGLIIVDQHAAHERIIYESILNNKTSAQHLLFPITLELNSEEYKVYTSTKDTLKSMGIEFKEFSNRTLVIDSLPADSKATREDLLGLFSDISGLGRFMNDKNELAKVLACHMAIKAGQKLSPFEMQTVIDNLFACENPFICPHGRPIIIKLTLDDLAKRFGR